MIERLAFGSNAFTDGSWSLEDAMRAIAREGYKAVNVLADAPLLWPLPLSKTRLKSIRDTLKETGLTVSGINGATASGYWGTREKPPGQDFGPCFADKEEGLRTVKVGLTKLVIDLAEQLDTQNISILSGYCPENIYPEEAWEWMQDAIYEALVYAERKDINLNMEFEPSVLINNSDDVDRLIRELDHPNLGINFDIGHSLVAREDVVAQIHRLGPYINGADIEDIGLDEHSKPAHIHLVPGDGVMPLEDIFRAFRAMGFENNHYYHVEMYSQFRNPVEAARRSMEYFRKLEEKLTQF